MIEPKILLSGDKGFAIRLKQCPMCGEKKIQREKHHIIPKFLKPVINITITICKPCHNKLNASYVKYPKLSSKNISTNFQEFRENYDKLRENFYARKLTRGQFGEALWTNLVTLLEEMNKK